MKTDYKKPSQHSSSMNMSKYEDSAVENVSEVQESRNSHRNEQDGLYSNIFEEPSARPKVGTISKHSSKPEEMKVSGFAKVV